MSGVLSGQVAVLVGGTSGIGLEIARHMAEAGCSAIALVGRNERNGKTAELELKQRWPGVATAFLAADVTQPVAVTALTRQITQRFGHVDTLVHGIGGEFSPEPFERSDWSTIDSLILTHLTSALYVTRAFLPTMIGRNKGSVLLIGSDAAKVATPGEAIIGAAKSGLAMFARTLALEVSRYHIRVNCLTPSIVQGTRTYDRLMANQFSATLFRKAEKRARLGVATPSDIAPLAVFLVSPLAAKITGQTISINSGISAA